jgi:hypothetical protein
MFHGLNITERHGPSEARQGGDYAVHVLPSTHMLLVNTPLRQQFDSWGMTLRREGRLARKAKREEAEINAPQPMIGELRLSACETRRLMSICVELLELCCHVSGRIDPAAGWMVAHARDEVMIGIFGVRP